MKKMITVIMVGSFLFFSSPQNSARASCTDELTTCQYELLKLADASLSLAGEADNEIEKRNQLIQMQNQRVIELEKELEKTQLAAAILIRLLKENGIAIPGVTEPNI